MKTDPRARPINFERRDGPTPEDFPWVTPEEWAWFDTLNFDIGDINEAINGFVDIDDIPTYLGCAKEDIEKYVRILYLRSWKDYWSAGYLKKRIKIAGSVEEWAMQGNSTAIKCVAELTGLVNQEKEARSAFVFVIDNQNKPTDDKPDK